MTNVLNLSGNWRASLDAELHPSDVPVVFQRNHAVNATIAFFMTSISPLDAQRWAEWLLKRQDVLVEEDQLREFLMDWAFGDPINADSVDVWQSRLAMS